MAKRWADRQSGAHEAAMTMPASARSSRSPIPIASRKIAAAGRAVSCWRTAAAPCSIRPRRWRASRSSSRPNCPAPRRRRASCWRRAISQAEIETHLRRPDRSARRSHRRSGDAQPARAQGAQARRHRVVRADRAGRAVAGKRGEARRCDRRRRTRPPALEQASRPMARPRHVPAQIRRRRMARPVRTPRSPQARRNGSRRCSPTRPR